MALNPLSAYERQDSLARILSADLIVSIPSDFPTLQAAVDRLSRIVTPNNSGITLMIEAGHELTSGLFVRGGDYTKFTILHEGDGVTPGSVPVPLSTGFVGVSDVGLNGNNTSSNLIMGYNAQMPVLGCVIDMAHEGSSGYYGVWNCTGFVLPGCGVINAGDKGLEWRGGFCSAHNSRWNGANNSGIRAAYGASLAVQSSQANDCCQIPETATTGAVDVSRTSSVHWRLGQARNSGAAGINCRRTSTITAQECDVSGAANTGAIIQHGCRASMYSSNFSDCGVYAVHIISGQADITGNLTNVSGQGGSWPLRLQSGAIAQVFSGVFNDTAMLNIAAYNTLNAQGICFATAS